MSRPRIVVIGAGFAGYQAARHLSRLARGAAEIIVINPTDYFLYVPLLPQVAAGILDPRSVSVSLPGNLPVKLLLGEASSVDLDRREVRWTDTEGTHREVGYDRLILTVGSVNKLLPIPGVSEHAHGFRGMPEALYLRDHITRQIELADVADDAEERAARRTFVVVGAGYTGTEVAAHGQLFTDDLSRRHRTRPGEGDPHWLLLDVAPRVLPELDEHMSRTAAEVLRGRGVDVRTGTSVKEAVKNGVLLTDDTFIPTHSLIWCVGVRPDPLVSALGLPEEKGRLTVDEYLNVPGHPEVFACGDAAAVPDLTRPGQVTPMTAQHAWRQGKRVAQNVAASYGRGRKRPYKHHDLGFVVELGGTDAAANPLGLPMSGLTANVVARAYHLMAMPGNRLRVAGDWLMGALTERQTVQLGLVRGHDVPLENTAPEVTASHRPPPPPG